jgi:hypothetical protein
LSNARTVLKCALTLFASLTLGVVVSFCGMLIVMAVNAWGDAPGAGFFILFALTVGMIAGVICGAWCSERLWKHRGELDQSKVFTAAKGSGVLLVGCSLCPAVLILPWTGPHDSLRIALSALVALVLAVGAALLIYRGAKIMTSNR